MALMKYEPRILGRGFIDKSELPAIQIGRSVYSRRVAATALGVTSWRACQNVTEALRRLGITSPAQLRGTPVEKIVFAKHRGRSLRVGLEGGFVLMRILAHHNEDPEAWVAGERDHVVTLSTIARREARARAAKATE